MCLAHGATRALAKDYQKQMLGNPIERDSSPALRDDDGDGRGETRFRENSDSDDGGDDGGERVPVGVDGGVLIVARKEIGGQLKDKKKPTNQRSRR